MGLQLTGPGTFAACLVGSPTRRARVNRIGRQGYGMMLGMPPSRRPLRVLHTARVQRIDFSAEDGIRVEPRRLEILSTSTIRSRPLISE